MSDGVGAVSDPGPKAPGGWYDEPGVPGLRRYWNGETWAESWQHWNGETWVWTDQRTGAISADLDRARQLAAKGNFRGALRLVRGLEATDDPNEGQGLLEVATTILRGPSTGQVRRDAEAVAVYARQRLGYLAASRGLYPAPAGPMSAEAVDDANESRGLPQTPMTVGQAATDERVEPPRRSVWPAGLALVLGAIGLWFAQAYKPSLSNTLGLNGNTFVLKPGAYHALIIVSIVLLAVGGIRLLMGLNR
jgi:hypothetical protein